MRNGMMTLQRYRMWTKEEIATVLRYVSEKHSIETISKKQRRSKYDVLNKLKNIAADLYLKDKLPFDKIEEMTSVKKEDFVISGSIGKAESTDCESEDIDVSIYEFPEESIVVEQGVKEPEPEPESMCDKISKPVATIVIPWVNGVKKYLLD